MNFNILGGFQKNEYFWGMKISWISCWGNHKIELVLRVISMHFRVFSCSQCTECGYFLGLQKFQIISVVLDIPDIFS